MPPTRQGTASTARRERRRVIRLETVPAGRMRGVFVLLCAGLIGLIGRMAWLQIFEASTLEARARVVQTQRTKPLGSRRPIVDRNGRLVALDEERYRLWAHPRYFNFPGDDPTRIRDSTEVAERLSQVLSFSPGELIKLMGDSSSGIKLAEGIDPETATSVRSLGISGIDLEPTPIGYIRKALCLRMLWVSSIKRESHRPGSSRVVMLTFSVMNRLAAFVAERMERRCRTIWLQVFFWR